MSDIKNIRDQFREKLANIERQQRVNSPIEREPDPAEIDFDDIHQRIRSYDAWIDAKIQQRFGALKYPQCHKPKEFVKA